MDFALCEAPTFQIPVYLSVKKNLSLNFDTTFFTHINPAEVVNLYCTRDQAKTTAQKISHKTMKNQTTESSTKTDNTKSRLRTDTIMNQSETVLKS